MKHKQSNNPQPLKEFYNVIEYAKSHYGPKADLLSALIDAGWKEDKNSYVHPAWPGGRVVCVELGESAFWMEAN